MWLNVTIQTYLILSHKVWTVFVRYAQFVGLLLLLHVFQVKVSWHNMF